MRPAPTESPAPEPHGGEPQGGEPRPAAVRAFDVCGPLPTGVTLLEASAGTGKTFTIAALTARYVAEGVPLERMLLVTFTRMATGELRERVRQRLVDTQRGLAGALAGIPPDPADGVLRLLATGPGDEVERRRDRLARALADFDAATITTTHGFCHRMLAGLGVAGDIESGTSVTEDVGDLVDDVVDDRYLARALQTARPPFDRATALRVARAALDNPRTRLAPARGDPDGPGRLRLRLALSVRGDVARRQRDRGLVTYDDLLTRLSDALTDEVSGEAARVRLRQTYDVVLVDEFQDTDELQWHILSDAFRHAGTTLVLIGDPKQAIYAFRGADVHAYLEAAGSADDTGTLDVNWRSDQGLLDALDALWGGVSLGHPDIVYRRVEAPPAHRTAGLDAPEAPAPLRIRVVHRDDGNVGLTPKGYARNLSARSLIGHDLAAQVSGLLSGETWLVARDDRPARRVQPGDIAVLTRVHRNATLWSAALAAAGVPAVLNGVGSVFATPAAREWLLLLEAVERPTSSVRVHNLALTGFVGWSAAQIDAADDAAWEGLHATCHHWAAVLRRSGVATLLELVTRTQALPERELARRDGERRLTDLRHLGQLLHQEATAGRLGGSALTSWLRLRIRDAALDTLSEERSRRLESDADAVQVLTIHRAKGLEFPIVLYPDLWEPSWIPEKDNPVTYHDTDGVRTVDVTGSGADFVRHQQWQTQELRGEDLRLAYVALTRPRHQALVWWAGSWDSRDSPIGRLLWARGTDGTVATSGTRTPEDAEAVERFEQLAASAPGCISVERVTAAATRRWSPPSFEPPDLSLASFERGIDNRWRRTSYSSLTSDAHDPIVTSEPQDPGLADEAPSDEADVMATAAPDDTDQSLGSVELRAVALPLAAMPGGTRVGSLLHAVLETVDFAADDLPGALDGALRAALARGPVPIGDPALVVAGLHAALLTPLGSLVGDRPLRALVRADRLDELAFELPVAGGDRPSGAVHLAAVADLIEAHLPAGDPLTGYPDHLRGLTEAGDFCGFLTGSLDLVARFGDVDGTARYSVMDYKTNLLGDDRAALSAWDYRPAALAVAMQRAHYPLQALLYLVALHRYLRGRLSGYTPSRHLGGALYLFLRGMTGADGPRVDGEPCGVFAWQPPTALVCDLSDLIDRGVAP